MSLFVSAALCRFRLKARPSFFFFFFFLNSFLVVGCLLSLCCYCFCLVQVPVKCASSSERCFSRPLPLFLSDCVLSSCPLGVRLSRDTRDKARSEYIFICKLSGQHLLTPLVVLCYMMSFASKLLLKVGESVVFSTCLSQDPTSRGRGRAPVSGSDQTSTTAFLVTVVYFF